MSDTNTPTVETTARKPRSFGRNVLSVLLFFVYLIWCIAGFVVPIYLAYLFFNYASDYVVGHFYAAKSAPVVVSTGKTHGQKD